MQWDLTHWGHVRKHPDAHRKDPAQWPGVLGKCIQSRTFLIRPHVAGWPTLSSTYWHFNIHGSMQCSNILIYIQQVATLHRLFSLETVLHVSGGTITHHQERKQLYLQHLVFVTLLLLPAATAAGSSNSVTNTRCCRYSRLRSWWWVMVPPKTCRAVSR